MAVFSLNNVPMDVTAAASSYDNSPSPFVSQFFKQTNFTFISSNVIKFEDCPVLEIVITVPSANSK